MIIWKMVVWLCLFKTEPTNKGTPIEAARLSTAAQNHTIIPLRKANLSLQWPTSLYNGQPLSTMANLSLQWPASLQ